MSKTNDGRKNNKGTKGNKGGGRKSAKQEQLDLKFLEDLFLGKMSKTEIEEKLKSGKYSIKDVMVAKAMAGNEKIIGQIINKIFPNKQEISGPGGKPVGIKFDLDEKDRKRIDKILTRLGSTNTGTK